MRAFGAKAALRVDMHLRGNGLSAEIAGVVGASKAIADVHSFHQNTLIGFALLGIRRRNSFCEPKRRYWSGKSADIVVHPLILTVSRCFYQARNS
jgi:hypothetical protein